MVNEFRYYFPEDITLMTFAYERLKRRLTELEGLSDDAETLQKLRCFREAKENYILTVPKNIRERLTGILFE